MAMFTSKLGSELPQYRYQAAQGSVLRIALMIAAGYIVLSVYSMFSPFALGSALVAAVSPAFIMTLGFFGTSYLLLLSEARSYEEKRVSG